MKPKPKNHLPNFTDKFEKYFVPSVLALVVSLLGAFLVIRMKPSAKVSIGAMAVLVAASPCALAISTLSAVLRWGCPVLEKVVVLIKGGRPLKIWAF